MELTDQLEIGRQAEEFLRYTEENGYFNGLLERVKLEYARTILSLDHTQKDEFAILRNKQDGIDDITEAIRGDIYLAQEALKKLNGETEEPKGLL